MRLQEEADGVDDHRTAVDDEATGGDWICGRCGGSGREERVEGGMMRRRGGGPRNF